MGSLRLLDLGLVPPMRSQTIYHAMAPETPDTLILVSPIDPYVCIGFHQDLESEVDLTYCRKRRLPVLRREVGGGAVYLDRDQIFVQWVFHRDHLPASIGERFEARFWETGATTVVFTCLACPQCVRTLTRGAEEVDGGVEVVEINEEVMSRPSLLNSDPHGEGWLVLLVPEDAERDLASLIHGDAVQPWLEESIADWRRRGLLKG